MTATKAAISCATCKSWSKSPAGKLGRCRKLQRLSARGEVCKLWEAAK